MVIYRDRQDLLGQILPDHVRGRELVLIGPRGIGGRALLADDVVAKLDAFVADEHRRPGDELPHFMLALAAEGAVEKLVTGRLVGHSPASGAPVPPGLKYTLQGLSPGPQDFID